MPQHPAEPPAPGRLQLHGARAERPRPERRGARPARRRVPAVSVPAGPWPFCRHPRGAGPGRPLRLWGLGSQAPLSETLWPLFRLSESDGNGRQVKGEPADVCQAPCLRTPKPLGETFHFQILRKAVSGALGIYLRGIYQHQWEVP